MSAKVLGDATSILGDAATALGDEECIAPVVMVVKWFIHRSLVPLPTAPLFEF